MDIDVDRLAARVLAAVGMPATPPLDVSELARRLGVHELVVEPMFEDGRLERTRGRTQIFLRDGVADTRRRFTVAHELGHLLLEDPGREFVAHRSWPRDDEVERFCDAFAAAVLLPRAWVAAAARGHPAGLASLRLIATRADTSLAATLVRLREVAAWRRSLLQWRRRENRWALSFTAGVPLALHNRVTSAPETRERLDALAGPRDVQTVLALNVSGVPRAVPVELSRRGATVVALAMLDGPAV